MDALFGFEFSLPVKFFLAFAIVLVLIGGTAYVVRRFASGGRDSAVQRGRQPRLAVVDAAPIDSRRRLVIVRRDNVEHLLLIGGPTDVLVEPNIVRGMTSHQVQPMRETAVRPADVMPPSVPEPVLRPEPARAPRPAPEETTLWPLQPHAEQPAVSVAVEVPTYPVAVAPPVAAAPEPIAPPPALEMSALRAATEEIFSSRPLAPLAPVVTVVPEPEPVAVPAPEPPRPVVMEAVQPDDHLAALAAALGDISDTPRSQPAALAQPGRTTLSDDQTIADMAQRLESALRRPSMTMPATPAPPPARQPQRAAAPAQPATPIQVLRAKAAVEPPRPQAAANGPTPPPPQRDALNYESLQREMAQLLGRPSGSS